MDKINLEITLSRLLLGLWPPSVDKVVYCNDQEFPLLVAEAEKISLKPRCNADHFYIMMSYTLAGFEAREGGWKAIFTPFVQTCSLASGLDKLNLSSLSDDTMAALLPLLGVEAEVCLDMPRMEKVLLPLINKDGLVVEGQETYWRMADKGRGA